MSKENVWQPHNIPHSTLLHTAQTYRSQPRRLHEPRQVRTPACVTSRTASSRMSYFSWQDL